MCFFSFNHHVWRIAFGICSLICYLVRRLPLEDKLQVVGKDCPSLANMEGLLTFNRAAINRITPVEIMVT